MIVVTSPEAIRHMFIENAKNYRMHPVRQAVLKPVLKDGLVTAEGEDWKFARRALSPVFVPRQVESFAASMASVTDKMLTDCFPDGEVMDISESFLKLAYGVLSETLFSGEIDGQSDEALRNISDFLSALGKADPLDILMAPKWLPRVTKLTGQGSVKRLRADVLRLAKDRRLRLEAGTEVPNDFLTRLLQTKTDDGVGFTDEQIVDQLATFIGAGHETTSRALTWLCYLLSQDTASLAKVETEIDNLDMEQSPKDWLDDIPLSMACFNESMRLYPPAPLISRQAIDADELADKTIAKDCGVLINLWSLHRHRAHWDRPDSFDPNRFMGDRAKSIDRFHFLPFGVGHRVCIGQRFALQEAAVIMSILFRKIRLHWVDGEAHPWPLMRVTTRPEKPLRMRVEWRR
jgi:cytochrome P450